MNCSATRITGFAPLENTNARQKYRENNSLTGFALLEVLIIIGIIGILALIGIPAFRVFQPGLQLSGTVQNLVADLRYAQQLTISEQITHGIRFSLAENKYYILKYGASEFIIKEELLSEGISFQQITGFANDEIKFNPYGAVEKAGTIVLVNLKGAVKTIDVRISGFIKVVQ